MKSSFCPCNMSGTVMRALFIAATCTLHAAGRGALAHRRSLNTALGLQGPGATVPTQRAAADFLQKPPEQSSFQWIFGSVLLSSKKQTLFQEDGKSWVSSEERLLHPHCCSRCPFKSMHFFEVHPTVHEVQA